MFAASLLLQLACAVAPGGDAVAVLAQHRIQVEPRPETWPDGWIEDLRRGLEALPQGLRTPPGGPLIFERHAMPAPFGMGTGAATLPEWSRDGRTFHLYDFEAPAEPRASFRTERLTDGERRSLWRRRAVVHAVMSRWDAVRRFSDAARWRAISGWPASATDGAKALIEYDWAFSRQRGRASAQLEFLTFAEEALVPVESVRSDAVSRDDSVFCQEKSRWRFLKAALVEVDPGWTPTPDGPCPAFDAFVDVSSFSHFELLLADPSSAHPESIFGHLLLRPVRHRSSGRVEEVLEVAAISDAKHGPLRFVFEGVRGGYLAAFGRAPLNAIRQRYLQDDQRGLRSFRLLLRDDEVERLWERVWELERRGYVRYYFFGQNCASLLLFVMAPVLDEPVEVPTPWAMPTAMLDLLAQQRRPFTLADGTRVELPLLVRAAAPFASNLQAAVAAEQQRDEALAQLADIAPGVGVRWRTFLEQARSTQADDRRRAYEDLGALVAQTLASPTRAGERRRALVREVLTSLLRVERYAADESQRLLRAIDASRIGRVNLGTRPAAEIITDRQQSFQREDPTRAAVELRRTIAQEWLRESAPRRAPTPTEALQIASAEASIAVYSKLAASVAGLMARHRLRERSPQVVEDPEAWVREQSVPAQRGSGHLRFALGAMFGGMHGRGMGGALAVRSALLAEHLGEGRDRGFGDNVELRGLDLFATLDVASRRSPIAAVDLDIMRFRALTAQPAQGGRDLLPAPGRGFGLSWIHRRDGAAPNTLRAHGELYVPFVAPNGRGAHALIGLGGFTELQFTDAAAELLAGPRIEWSQRLPFGPYQTRALRFDLIWFGGIPASAPRDGPRLLQHRVEARGVLDVPLRVGGRDLLVSPMVTVEGDVRPAGTSLRLQGGVLLERL